MSVNKVILIGNLGKDPEVRFTQTGSAVANFSIATSEQWNDRDGKRQERTEWHNIVVWGKQAESCGQYLSKGRQQTLHYRDRRTADSISWWRRWHPVAAADRRRPRGRDGHGRQSTADGG